jgi:hypothetical protein
MVLQHRPRGSLLSKRLPFPHGVPVQLLRPRQVSVLFHLVRVRLGSAGPPLTTPQSSDFVPRRLTTPSYI